MSNFRFAAAISVAPILGMAVLASPSGAQQRPAVADELAKTYGIQSFGQIDAIRYTFTGELPGITLFRTWTWEPKTDRVTYEGKDKSGQPVKITYLRSQLGSQPAEVTEKIDPGFVNDQYWLLLPFHVIWDSSAAVTDDSKQKLPQGTGSAEKIVVKYPSDAGYSQGDTWDLYVGANGRIEEMVYHRGGPMKPSLVSTTWAGYKKAGPLLVSTEHRGTADGKPVHVFFSNVAVKLSGSSSWTKAQ